MKKIIFIGIMLSFMLTSCGNTIITKYDFKELNGCTDKVVEIKQVKSKTSGRVDISFEKKEIPFSIDINGSKKSYELKIEVNGEFKIGSIDTSLVYNETRDKTVRINSGAFKKTIRTEYYGGPYKILIEFNNTEKGYINLKYQLLSL
jgi:hypothetical protein